MREINLSEKYLLTVDEVVTYFGIGETKARMLLNDPASDFTVFNGHKLLANRKKMEKYFDQIRSI